MTPSPATSSSAIPRQIRKVQQQGRLNEREAAVLFDMLNAGRAEVGPAVAFVDRYLPRPIDGSKLVHKSAAARRSLIAGESELMATRARIKSDRISAALWDELLAKCKGFMTPGSETFIDWLAQRNVDLWDRRRGHWVMTVAMQDLAWAGAIGRERKLSRYAADILVTIARRRQGWGPMHCNYGNPYKGWLFDNLLDLGHITLGSAIAYDLVRGLLSADERAEVAAYFEPFFHKALTHRYESLRAPGNNFSPIGFGGAGLMALAVADEYPAHRRGVLIDVLAWAQAYAVFALDHIAGDDGAPIEGSGYGSASLYYTALFAQALHRAHGRDLLNHPTVQRLAQYLAIESLPGGGAINNFNDNHYETHVALWPMLARHTGNPLGDWLWRSHEGVAPDAPTRRVKGSLCAIPYLLLFRDPATDAATPESLGVPRVHHFPGLDHLTMRTGWGRRDLHVTFQCTEPPAHAHTQEDRLNYTVYALGERIVVDSGYGMVPIKGSSEVRRMGKPGESHNQVLMDGKGQSHRAGVPAGKIVRWKREGDWVWALGDATGSYESASIARRLLAVRLTAEQPVIVQVDWIAPGDGATHQFDCLLQIGEGNKVRFARNGVATITGKHRGAMSIGYATHGPARPSVDEWIDHPRLRWASHAKEHVAVLVMSAGEVAPSRSKTPAVTWTDALGSGTVRVSRARHQRGARGAWTVEVPSGGPTVTMD